MVGWPGPNLTLFYAGEDCRVNIAHIGLKQGKVKHRYRNYLKINFNSIGIDNKVTHSSTPQLGEKKNMYTHT